VGIGVDIVGTERFAAVLARTPSIVARVFTAEEVALCGGDRLRTDSLAARWAAKEAVAKVLVETVGLEWHDCQVLGGEHGQPRLELRGTVEQAARSRGINGWHVSLSHDGGMAVAFVVAVRTASR
jgi:holo-[acyl-carrier protein] synthase